MSPDITVTTDRVDISDKVKATALSLGLDLQPWQLRCAVAAANRWIETTHPQTPISVIAEYDLLYDRTAHLVRGLTIDTYYIDEIAHLFDLPTSILRRRRRYWSELPARTAMHTQYDRRRRARGRRRRNHG